MVQRIDFGPRQIRAEGMVGGSPMWRLGSLRAEMLRLVGERLRHVCGAAGLWRGGPLPDTLQLTRMGPAQKLASHYDRRDRWQEGIASVAWSELPSEADLRGDSWTLVMERGSKKELKKVELEMAAGCAYVLTGVAQGCTKHCERKCVGHNRCGCCWLHGVRANKETYAARQSMTLRLLADSDDESEAEDDVEDREEDGEKDNEQQHQTDHAPPEARANGEANGAAAVEEEEEDGIEDAIEDGILEESSEPPERTAAE